MPFNLDAKTAAALGTTTCKDLATIGSLHAGAKTVVAFTFNIAGLIRTFGSHSDSSTSITGGKDLKV
jgi:hypothetical protein